MLNVKKRDVKPFWHCTGVKGTGVSEEAVSGVGREVSEEREEHWGPVIVLALGHHS